MLLLTSRSLSLVFSVSNGIAKKLFKTMKKKKKKYSKIVLLARRNLNSTENIISKALTGNEISHEDFTIIVNEEKKHRK